MAVNASTQSGNERSKTVTDIFIMAVERDKSRRE